MKKEILFGLCMGIIAMASCQKERITPPETDNLATVTIRADFANPSDTPSSKTSVEYDEANKQFIPHWIEGDQLGVFAETITTDNVVTKTANNNLCFSASTINDDGSATFTGTFDVSKPGTYELYAYYPYYKTSPQNNTLTFDLKTEQHPSETSFDGTTDRLIASPAKITIGEDGSISIDKPTLEFKRMTAMIVLRITSTDQTISSISKATMKILTPCPEEKADKYRITGRKTLMYSGGGSLKHNSKGRVPSDQTVSAAYEQPLPINKDVLLNVAPVTFDGGEEIEFEVINGDGKVATKKITLTGAKKFEAGKAALIELDITASDQTATELFSEGFEGFIANTQYKSIKNENGWHFNYGTVTKTESYIVSGTQSACIYSRENDETLSYLERIEPVNGANYVTFKIRKSKGSTPITVSYKIGETTGEWIEYAEKFQCPNNNEILSCKVIVSETVHSDDVYIKFAVDANEQRYSIDDIVFYKSIQ